VARVFARLKLRLITNRLRRSTVIQAFGFLVSWLLAIATGIGLGYGYGALLRVAKNDLAISGAVFSLAFLAWLLLPIVAATLDDTMEARQFELLPYTSRQLAFGLTVAAFVGPGALMTILMFGIGIGVGYGFGPVWILQVLAAIAGLGFMIVVSRWVTTLLTDLLRSRRTQEIAALTIVGLLTLPGVAGSLLVAETADGTSGGFDIDAIVDGVEPLAWTPPGVFGLLVDSLESGAWARIGVGVVYGAVGLAVAGLLFARSVDRLQTRAAVNKRSRRRRGGITALYPKRYPLPRTPVGAVAAKELKYLVRDSRVKAQLIGGLVATVVLVGTGGAALADTPYAPFSAAFIGFLVTASVIPNQFGFDGGSFWAYQSSSIRLIDVLAGKNLGWAAVSLPLVVIAAVAAAVLSGDATYLIAGVLAGVSVSAMFTAGGNLTSILGAYPLPESNLFGSRNVSGTALIFSFLGLGLSGLLIVPIALLIGIPAWLSGPMLATLGAVGATIYGLGGYALSMRWIHRLLESRALWLLETIDKER
jgi:ABC-2 type transport system permease protein